MKPHLVIQRGTQLFYAELHQLVAVREPTGVQHCPGLAEGWSGFQLTGGELSPVYDPAPDLPPAPLLVLADIDGLRLAIAAEGVEQADSPPPGSTPLAALYAALNLL